MPVILGMSTTLVRQPPVAGLPQHPTGSSARRMLLCTAAQDLAKWFGTAWALAVHFPPEGGEVDVRGTPPDSVGLQAYIVSLSEASLDSDEDKWHLHVPVEGCEADQSQVVVWSRSGEALSAIALGSKLSAQPYSASDCRLILDTVEHSCPGFRNDDLAVARDVQQRCMPLRLPSMKGLDCHGESSPACELGGEFFDLIPVREDCLAISVGDVSGHGIASALLMSGVQAYVRRLTVEKKRDLGALISELNRISYEISPENFFTSLFYSQIDVDKNRLSYVNAGHEPAILVRQDLRTVERLKSTGTVLGFSALSRYEIGAVTVQPGDALIAFTDGVSDPIYAAGYDFETEVLAAMRRDAYASAFDIAQAILSLVPTSALAGDDDRTLVVVRLMDTMSMDKFTLAHACVATAAA